MGYYPILLNLTGETALVVGGGEVAERKVESLLACGASVRLVARDLTHGLQRRVAEGDIRHVGREFEEKHMEGTFLAVAATSDTELNRRISRQARKRGMLINAVDQPGDCNFIVPSVVRRGDLILAISTSGDSPALAKKIRMELETRFGEEYASFLSLLGRVRKAILSLGLGQKENERIFRDIVDSDILAALRRGAWEEAGETLGRLLPAGTDVQGLLNHGEENRGAS